jgi:hypothetical protein
MVNPNRRIDQDHSGFGGRRGAAIKMTEAKEGERNAVQMPAAGSGNTGTVSRSCACPQQMV